jgi:hypothetical protein
VSLWAVGSLLCRETLFVLSINRIVSMRAGEEASNTWRVIAFMENTKISRTMF